MPSFTTSDRILVIAPHPDDESLGSGGLLQRAFACGAPVRILFATNGDNNPWAQRYWEKRWNIGPKERARWGRRRREEALAAIGELGGTQESARFMDLADLGATELLMRGGPDLPLLLAREIEQWQPTMALIPAIFDAHPDHSALAVAYSVAREMTGQEIGTWEYLVHPPRLPILQTPVNLLLTADEVEKKRKAILRHETQVALSYRRFTRFARLAEPYYSEQVGEAAVPDSRLAGAGFHEEVLRLRFNVSWRERYDSRLFLIFRNTQGDLERWLLPVPLRSGPAYALDTAEPGRIRRAIVHWRRSLLFVDIPVPDRGRLDTLFAKFCGKNLFFERSGWSRLTVAQAETGAKSFFLQSRAIGSVSRT